MPKLFVNDTFQAKGAIYRAGSIVTISKADLAGEVAKGKHPENGKWISGILNHCEPEDEEAAELTTKETPDKPSPEEIADEEAARMATIRAEMDEMGAAYDRRWKLPKMENELVMAKKSRGL